MALSPPRSQYTHLLTPCVECGRLFLKSDMRPTGDGPHICRPCIRKSIKCAPQSAAAAPRGKRRRTRDRTQYGEV